MIKAIFFDMDGTLVDTEGAYAEAFKQVLDEATSGDFPLVEAYETVCGKSWEGIFEAAERRFPGAFSSTKDLQGRASMVFDVLVEQQDFIIQESLNLLKKLSETLPIAIVSGSSREHIQAFMQKMKIVDLVKFYVGSEDCVHSKPSPEGYLKAASQMGIEPEAGLVFEDSTAGVLAAKAANMKCVALCRPEAPSQDIAGADLVLASLSDFSFSQL